MGMLRCTIPIPPWRAMAIARRDSVTVSMAAEASGMFRASFLAKFVVVSTSPGSTDDLPGKSSTSSKVRPSEIGPSLIPEGLTFDRSEEHTSELRSLRHLVCRLLLEKKKNKKDNQTMCKV